MLIILFCEKVVSQPVEYFLLNNGRKINRVDLEVNHFENNTLNEIQTFTAYYSPQNKLDSIYHFDENICLKSKIQFYYTQDCHKSLTTYYNELEDVEIYLSTSFEKGEKSYTELSNNIDGRGYKNVVLFDTNCVESEKVRYHNGDIIRREIIENIYLDKNKIDEYCERYIYESFNSFKQLNLDQVLSFKSFDQYKTENYQEVKGLNQFFKLKGDTIVKIVTDSISAKFETRTVYNDSINYKEVIRTTINGLGANTILKTWETDSSSIKEDYASYEGMGIDNSYNYVKRITNIDSVFVYSEIRGETDGSLNIDTTTLRRNYLYDENENWIEGIYEKGMNKKIVVKRTIKYN